MTISMTGLATVEVAKVGGDPRESWATVAKMEGEAELGTPYELDEELKPKVWFSPELEEEELAVLGDL